MKHCLPVVFFIAVFCAVANPVPALQDWADQEVIEEAAVIAKVKVISLEESEQSGNIYYTVQINDCLKGELKSSNMLIRVPRSFAPAQKTGQTRPFDVGQDATMYLKAGPQGIARSSTVLALVPDQNRIR